MRAAVGIAQNNEILTLSPMCLFTLNSCARMLVMLPAREDDTLLLGFTLNRACHARASAERLGLSN